MSGIDMSTNKNCRTDYRDGMAIDWAMAAQPVTAIISLALPRLGGMAIAQQLYEGMLPLADEMGVSVAGGDTNSWDQPLAIKHA